MLELGKPRMPSGWRHGAALTGRQIRPGPRMRCGLGCGAEPHLAPGACASVLLKMANGWRMTIQADSQPPNTPPLSSAGA
jgi:hypothetical protein